MRVKYVELVDSIPGPSKGNARCLICNQELPEDAAYCTNCGANVEMCSPDSNPKSRSLIEDSVLTGWSDLLEQFNISYLRQSDKKSRLYPLG